MRCAKVRYIKTASSRGKNDKLRCPYLYNAVCAVPHAPNAVHLLQYLVVSVEAFTTLPRAGTPRETKGSQ